MKCHNDNETSNHKSSFLKHAIHMVICCGLPILILALIPFAVKLSPALGGVLGLIAPFICPLMMGGMLFSMFRGEKRKKNCCSAADETTDAIS